MSFKLKRSISKRIKMLKKVFRSLEKEYAQVSYSQQGEDLTIMRLLDGKVNGFFVDVGAFHPIKYSNTYAFYKKGWRGINIEPNPDVRGDFFKWRSLDLNLNLAIGNSEEKLSYYKFNVPAVNSFSLEHVNKWKEVPGFEVTEVLKIQVLKLKDVLSKHLPVGQKIDFMTIDVESFDLDVLRSNDWNLYRPGLLLVEEDILRFCPYTDSPIVSYLQSQNYLLKTVCNGTIFFIDELNK